MCALCVLTTNLPEDNCLLGCHSFWSVRCTYSSGVQSTLRCCLHLQGSIAALSSEMSVHMYQFTCHHLPQDIDLHSYCF